MPQGPTRRELSEAEFNAIRDRVLDTLPPDLDEAGFNRLAPTLLEQAVSEAEYSPAPVEGGAIGRFIGGAAEMLNPVTMAKGLYTAVTNPIDTIGAIAGQQFGQGKQAITAAREGRPVEALGHGAAALLPVVGPMAARAGEKIAAGDVAGGVGQAAGMLAPFGVSAAVRARAARQPQRAAELTREAQQQVAQRVLAPGNPAFRGRAQTIAPEMLQRRLSGDRTQLSLAAEEGMADAAAKLDDAIQSAGGVKAPVPVQEILSGLRSRIADLKDSTGKPLSDAAAKRIRALEQRQHQVQALGGRKGVVTFEDLRKIRDENYRLADEARGYQRQGNPAMADEGWAAREAGGVIRQTFARRSPASAAANADYTFWKTLHDVLDPAIGRPKATGAPTGVTGGARTSGAVAGALIGPKAAFVMSTVVPWLKDRLASPGWALADANAKMRLADAIKRGDVGRAKSLMVELGKYGGPVGRSATSPSELQMQPAPTR